MSTSATHSLSQLTSGYCTSSVRVRIIRTWESNNFNNESELMSFDMLLLDDQGSCVHAIVPKQFLSKLRHRFVEGQLVILKNFRIVDAPQQYRPVVSAIKLQCISTTVVKPISDTVPLIPLTFFDFADTTTLERRKGNPTILTDVIGRLNGVGPIEEVFARGKPTSIRRLSLQLDASTTIAVCLWRSVVSQISESVLDENAQPIVVAITSTTVAEFKGEFNVSSTTCTRVYMNPDVPETATVKERFPDKDAKIRPMLPPPNGNTNLELRMTQNRKTLSEILQIEWTTEFKALSFTIRATVKTILLDYGWSYNACTSCGTKLTRQEGVLSCGKCKRIATSSNHRYKVNARVFDGTATATVTIFDREIVRLIGIPAAQLVIQQCDSPGLIPPQLQHLCERQFIFEIQVSEKNVLEGFETYTVTRALPVTPEVKKEDVEKDVSATSEVEKETVEKDRVLPLTSVVEEEDISPSGFGASTTAVLPQKQERKRSNPMLAASASSQTTVDDSAEPSDDRYANEDAKRGKLQ